MPESRRRTGYGRLDATPSRSVHAQPAGPRRKEGQTDRCSSAAHSLRSGHVGRIDRTLDRAPSRDIAAQYPAGQWIDARIREDRPQSENKVTPPTRPLCSACRLREGGDACFTRPSAFCTSAETPIRANTKAHELWLTGSRRAQFRLTPCKTGEPDGGCRMANTTAGGKVRSIISGKDCADAGSFRAKAAPCRRVTLLLSSQVRYALAAPQRAR